MAPIGFRCAVCGDLAATVELIAPTLGSSGPGEIGHDRWKLAVTGPVPATHWVLRSLAELQGALERRSIVELRALNDEYANFWCPHCEATYCPRHWQPIEPEMDEGFYDATYGTCPRGHRVMLDD